MKAVLAAALLLCLYGCSKSTKEAFLGHVDTDLELAQSLDSDLIFWRREGTDLCFVRSRSQGHGRVASYVPCEKVPPEIVNMVERSGDERQNCP